MEMNLTKTRRGFKAIQLLQSYNLKHSYRNVSHNAKVNRKDQEKKKIQIFVLKKKWKNILKWKFSHQNIINAYRFGVLLFLYFYSVNELNEWLNASEWNYKLTFNRAQLRIA